MRVLHLWDTYAPELFDHSLSICREEGLPVSLVCMNLIERGAEAAPEVRFVRRIRAEGTAGPLTRRLRRLIDRSRFRDLASSEVERFRPDVIHIHYGTTGALLARSEFLRSIPFVISFYGFDISQALRTPAIRDSYRRLFALRPLVHVLCDEAAERAASLGADRGRIVDANLPLAVERYPDIGTDPSRISRWLLPARFVEKKGHDIALRAFARRLATHPDDRLTCWGYGDPTKIEHRIAELGLDERVTVIDNGGRGDFDEDYLAQLRAHDAVLVPSLRSRRGDDEGGPALTAVLAQVAGKPLIVSDFPGHERSVSDGVEGLVVAQGDDAALAAAMDALAGDPARAARMGEAGRKRAIREFGRDAYRDTLLGWYRDLSG
jgi:glycosyltransferase involved in cell wall biosynthesis